MSASLRLIHGGRSDVTGVVCRLLDTDTIRVDQVGEAIGELRAVEREQVGADIVLLSEMALKPWPPEAA